MNSVFIFVAGLYVGLIVAYGISYFTIGRWRRGRERAFEALRLQSLERQHDLDVLIADYERATGTKLPLARRAHVN